MYTNESRFRYALRGGDEAAEADDGRYVDNFAFATLLALSGGLYLMSKVGNDEGVHHPLVKMAVVSLALLTAVALTATGTIAKATTAGELPERATDVGLAVFVGIAAACVLATFLSNPDSSTTRKSIMAVCTFAAVSVPMWTAAKVGDVAVTLGSFASVSAVAMLSYRALSEPRPAAAK